jgi:hypothetical protein
MEIIGYIVAGIGILIAVAGELMVLTAIYRRGAILFITCLVVPFLPLAFALAHIRTLWLPVLLAFAGCLFAFGGVWLSGSEGLMEVLFG